MLQNIIKTSLRNLWKHPGYGLVMLFGLSMGVLAALYIAYYIQDERSFDQHLPEKDRLYRVYAEYKMSEGGFQGYAITPYRLAPALESYFEEEIDEIFRVGVPGNNMMVASASASNYEDQLSLVDPESLAGLGVKLLAGNPETALREPFTMVLSATMAEKYFNSTDVVGKTLRIENQFDVKIDGVFQDMPRRSHAHLKFLISMETGDVVYPDIVKKNWGEGSQYTYVVLKPNLDPHHFKQLLPEFVNDHIPGQDQEQTIRYHIQRASDIHLTSHLTGELEANGDLQYIYLFAAVALIVLLLALLNYVNLATARSVLRAREVGLRKTLGAQPVQLMLQFTVESLVILLIAIVVGMVLLYLLLPWLNALSGKPIEGYAILNWWYYPVFIWLGAGMMAGAYPAFVLTRYQAGEVLKRQVIGLKSGGRGLRSGLVTFQFTLAFALIATTAIIFMQFRFLQDKKLGMQTENIVIFPLQDTTVVKKWPVMKQELLKHPNITGATASNKRVTRRLSSFLDYRFSDSGATETDELNITTLAVDPDFLSVFDLQIIEGRGFQDLPRERTSSIILNEKALETFGLKDVVGQQVQARTMNRQNAWETYQGEIVGVVQDFHFESLHEEIIPLAMHVSNEWLNVASVRVEQSQISKTTAYMEEVFADLAPGRTLNYTFLEEDVAALYLEEENFLRLFSFFSLLSIIIAVMGMTGLAAYETSQRTKEIGIRKVLGASVKDVMRLLLSHISRLIVVALIIAVPLAFYLANTWLQDFPYRIKLHIGLLVIAAICGALIALAGVSFIAWRAVRMNVATAIQYE